MSVPKSAVLAFGGGVTRGVVDIPWACGLDSVESEMPPTANIEKGDRRQQGNSGSRAITVLYGFHIGVGDRLMLKRRFFGDLKGCLFTMIERLEITSPQGNNVGIGNEHICGSVLPLGVAIVNGCDTQATQFQHPSADLTVVPQGFVESFEARP